MVKKRKKLRYKSLFLRYHFLFWTPICLNVSVKFKLKDECSLHFYWQFFDKPVLLHIYKIYIISWILEINTWVCLWNECLISVHCVCQILQVQHLHMSCSELCLWLLASDWITAARNKMWTISTSIRYHAEWSPVYLQKTLPQ